MPKLIREGRVLVYAGQFLPDKLLDELAAAPELAPQPDALGNMQTPYRLDWEGADELALRITPAELADVAAKIVAAHDPTPPPPPPVLEPPPLEPTPSTVSPAEIASALAGAASWEDAQAAVRALVADSA